MRNVKLFGIFTNFCESVKRSCHMSANLDELNEMTLRHLANLEFLTIIFDTSNTFKMIILCEKIHADFRKL